jgi:hypothetical protein
VVEKQQPLINVHTVWMFINNSSSSSSAAAAAAARDYEPFQACSIFMGVGISTSSPVTLLLLPAMLIREYIIHF